MQKKKKVEAVLAEACVLFLFYFFTKMFSYI